MTDDPEKRLRIELDHEHKVIRLGYMYHELKGVMICESTEEERSRFFCGRFMTYPIVDDNWAVREDDCIRHGIENLTIGKRGDSIPLIALYEALELSAETRMNCYADILMSVESNGITVLNSDYDEPDKELPDTIVLRIEKIRANEHLYRIESHTGSYFIPLRFFYIGEDDELYQLCTGKDGTDCYTKYRIVDAIARDVMMLSWFFHKPNLRVLVTCLAEWGYPLGPDVLTDIPKDWYYTIQTLDRDINRALNPKSFEYLNLKFPGYSRFN